MDKSQGILYNSIDNILIGVFYDILKGGDLTLLGNHEDLEAVWLDIYNDYCVASKIDNSNIKQMGVVEGLKVKYDYITECFEKLRYSHYLSELPEFKENKKKVVEVLRSLGYLFDNTKVFEEELIRLRRQSETLRMKIIIEEKKVEKSDKKLAINVWKELVSLEKVTGIKLDPNTDVLAKLIEVKNMGNDIIKQQRAA